MGLIDDIKKDFNKWTEDHPVAWRRIKIGTCVGGGLIVGYKVGKDAGIIEGKDKAIKDIKSNMPSLPSSEPDEYRMDWVDPYYVSEPERGVIGEFFYEDTKERLDGYVKYTEECAEEYIEDYGYKGEFNYPQLEVEATEVIEES